MRRPSGSSPGKNVAANRSLTIAASWPAAPSPGANDRPRRTCRPSARFTARRHTRARCSRFLSGRPSTTSYGRDRRVARAAHRRPPRRAPPAVEPPTAGRAARQTPCAARASRSAAAASSVRSSDDAADAGGGHVVDEKLRTSTGAAQQRRASASRRRSAPSSSGTRTPAAAVRAFSSARRSRWSRRCSAGASPSRGSSRDTAPRRTRTPCGPSRSTQYGIAARSGAPISGGERGAELSTPQVASTRPATPARWREDAFDRGWRTMRERVAPSDDRIAIRGARDGARPHISIAMLAQPNSTKTTAPIIVIRIGRMKTRMRQWRHDGNGDVALCRGLAAMATAVTRRPPAHRRVRFEPRGDADAGVALRGRDAGTIARAAATLAP